MKKTCILIACGILAANLSACAGSSASTATSTVPESTEVVASVETTATDDSSNLNSLGNIKVDEGLFNVELTIPKDYVGETTQEELDATAKEKGYKSITLNEDGSATYLMTKRQHKEMMEELGSSINSSLQEMIGSEDYPNITSIVADNNFTKFEITTKSTELDMAESFSVLGFYLYGGMYNIFNGTPADDVSVTFINADSGEVISTANSNDTNN